MYFGFAQTAIAVALAEKKVFHGSISFKAQYVVRMSVALDLPQGDTETEPI